MCEREGRTFEAPSLPTASCVSFSFAGLYFPLVLHWTGCSQAQNNLEDKKRLAQGNNTKVKPKDHLSFVKFSLSRY